jgi:hypothetical protein
MSGNPVRRSRGLKCLFTTFWTVQGECLCARQIRGRYPATRCPPSAVPQLNYPRLRFRALLTEGGAERLRLARA